MKRLAMMLVFALPLAAQTTVGPTHNSSIIDADGTARITRIVPLPETLSDIAKEHVGRQVSDAKGSQTLAARRAEIDAWQHKAIANSSAVYPVRITESSVAGVPVHFIDPVTIAADKQDRVLMNLHGGGFNSDSGSYSETIPIANLTGTRVVAVLYRLAPEHPYPAALDDAIAVYRELLKTHKPEKIAIFGTSAGAILTAEVAVKIHQLGLPMPGALGVFSGRGDYAHSGGDSAALFTQSGLSGYLAEPHAGPQGDEYLHGADPRDPVVSPIYADVKGFPPTLFITSGRDVLLSGTTDLQRHFYEAGVDAPMVVFSGMPHAFWNNVAVPESREAYRVMADFLDKQLSR